MKDFVLRTWWVLGDATRAFADVIRQSRETRKVERQMRDARPDIDVRIDRDGDDGWRWRAYAFGVEVGRSVFPFKDHHAAAEAAGFLLAEENHVGFKYEGLPNRREQEVDDGRDDREGTDRGA